MKSSKDQQVSFKEKFLKIPNFLLSRGINFVPEHSTEIILLLTTNLIGYFSRNTLLFDKILNARNVDASYVQSFTSITLIFLRSNLSLLSTTAM